MSKNKTVEEIAKQIGPAMVDWYTQYGHGHELNEDAVASHMDSLGIKYPEWTDGKRTEWRVAAVIERSPEWIAAHDAKHAAIAERRAAEQAQARKDKQFYRSIDQ